MHVIIAMITADQRRADDVVFVLRYRHDSQIHVTLHCRYIGSENKTTYDVLLKI